MVKKAKNSLLEFYTKRKNILLPLIIVVLLILFIIFVYYPIMHDSQVLPLIAVIIVAILFFIGVYAFFIEKSVKFEEIKMIYLIWMLISLITETIMILAVARHGFGPKIDIVLYWGYTTFGAAYIYIEIFLSIISIFFVVAGTYRIFKKYYVYPWAVVFIAWIISNTRLFLRYVVR